MLTLSSHGGEQPIVLSEFGGIACAEDARRTWGYSRAENPADLAQRYARLLRSVHGLRLFAGFCYTQFADTYQEANGLLYADRTPKFPIAEIARATQGPRSLREEEADLEWRIRMMEIWRAAET